jgi:hypothetical protein
VDSGFYISIYWINSQAEFTINYHTLNLAVSTLRYFFTGWPLVFFCASSPISLSCLRAICCVTAFTSHLELAENYFELNCRELDSGSYWTELASFRTRYITSARTTHRKLRFYCWNMCTNHCIATVATLINCWAGYCLATSSKHSFFYCCVATNRRVVFTSALHSNERAFRCFYGFSSSRMVETRHNTSSVTPWYSYDIVWGDGSTPFSRGSQAETIGNRKWNVWSCWNSFSRRSITRTWK